MNSTGGITVIQLAFICTSHIDQMSLEIGHVKYDESMDEAMTWRFERASFQFIFMDDQKRED